jgi:hypothetical protein
MWVLSEFPGVERNLGTAYRKGFKKTLQMI